MPRSVWLVSAFALLLLAPSACSDDSNGPGKEAGTLRDTGSADLSQRDGSSRDAVTGDSQSVTQDQSGAKGDGAKSGACTNTADRTIIDNPATKIQDKISACATGCAFDPNRESCVAACVVKDVKLSTACATCFGKVTACTFDKCMPTCMAPNSPDCVKCRDKNCVPAFLTCSGLPPQT